jgi:hypothetical protein
VRKEKKKQKKTSEGENRWHQQGRGDIEKERKYYVCCCIDSLFFPLLYYKRETDAIRAGSGR